MFCCNWCIYLLISTEKQRLSGFQLACFHKSLLSASQTTWRFSPSPFTVTTVSNKHKHLYAALAVFNMEMSLHSHLISVKRLRIEKGTSDDAEKFEAVADTGKWNYYCILFSICWSFECHSREYCLFQSLSTQRAVYRLMIFLWVTFQRYESSDTVRHLKPRAHFFSLSFLFR